MRGAIALSSFPVGASRSNNESERLIQIIREKTIVKKRNEKLHSFSMYLSNVAMTIYYVASSLIKFFIFFLPVTMLVRVLNLFIFIKATLSAQCKQDKTLIC